MSDFVYLDNAATTFPKPAEVIDAMADFCRKRGVNPGRTGFDLALEAEENIPVDYGMIIYLRVIDGVPRFRLRCFTVGDELRREFLELRDEAYELLTLEKDPGKPPRCPSYCPYYKVCMVEGI